MKKSIVLLSTVIGALSLTAFIFINQRLEEVPISSNPTDSQKDSVLREAPIVGLRQPFVYEIGSRFIATVTKEQIEEATTAQDLLPDDAGWSKHAIERLNVNIEGKQGKFESGSNLILTSAQLALLKSTAYSDNFRLVARPKPERDGKKLRDLVYYVTVIPEKEATYMAGNEKLIIYLKDKSAEAIVNAEEKTLQPGQIFFTISKAGTITNVVLNQSSGYAHIDARMIELLMNAPGNWKPAENGNGEKIEQTFTFFYGETGC